MQALSGNRFICGVGDRERVAAESLVEPLLATVRAHEGGSGRYAEGVISALCREFLKVEEPFSLLPEADVIDALRQNNKAALSVVLDVVLSHQVSTTEASPPFPPDQANK